MEELELAFQSIDIDGDGKITKEEMVQWGSLNTQEVNAVFELGDVDRDGAIDITEFCGVMTSCSPVPYTVSLERSPEVITSSHYVMIPGERRHGPGWRQAGLHHRQRAQVRGLVSRRQGLQRRGQDEAAGGQTVRDHGLGRHPARLYWRG